MQNPQKKPLNPASLPLAAAAKLLSAAGGVGITADQIEADVLAGAPTNADGTLNLVQYCAWLTKEMGRGD